MVVHIPSDLVFSFLTHVARAKLSLAQQHGLGLRELLILGMISTQGPASFKQLHELLSIPKSALTGLIDQLHERRLVDRRQDSLDRRRWFVALTSPGHRLVERIKEEDTRLLRNALESLEEPEQTAFLKAAEAVQKALAQATVSGPSSTRRRRKRPRAAGRPPTTSG